MTLAADQIQTLASDAQVLAAGRKLGKPSHWQRLGRQGDAIWGECQGSTLYQVRADTLHLGYSCSCPSRKHPCKHVIGLLTLANEHMDLFPEAAPPPWVAEWPSRRDARAQNTSAEPAAQASRRPSTAPQRERRMAERQRRILDGIDGLDLWMSDMVRNGLATVEAQPASFWQHQAARLVDAEAPGLASLVRRLATIPGSSAQWPERLIGELGRLQLLIHAYRGIDQLDPSLRHDVRAQVGRRLTRAEVAEAGEHVADAWVCVGQVVEEDDQLRVQRTWLHGLRTGRTAVVLQFVVGKTASFPLLATLNHIQEVELHFWPSAWPQRALIARRLGEPVYSKDRRPGYASIEDMLTFMSRGLAANPWMERCLAVLHDVVPIRTEDETWVVRDRSGATLPLQPRAHWRMLAQSGGHPIDVHGEWDGFTLHSFAFRITETGT